MLRSFSGKALGFGAAAVAIAAPMAWLFDLHGRFYFDWDHSMWLVGYVGEYWRVHGALPMVLNSGSGVGSPLPIFYGFLLYPLLAPLAAWLGAALAVRIGIAALLLLQFHALVSAGRKVWGRSPLVFATACTVLWSVYEMTDLYNRSDLPEYFATGFLFAFVGYAVAAAAARRSVSAFFYGWMAVLCVVLSCG
ncbi:MAG: hypothetical protein ACREFX_15285, partial [Opitutaceae bacterium]